MTAASNSEARKRAAERLAVEQAFANDGPEITPVALGDLTEGVRRSTVAKNPDERHSLPSRGCE